jgi:hypothetical protein
MAAVPSGALNPARGYTLLLRWLRQAQFRAQPGRTLASVAAVAIGVALALAIHLVNASALDSFRHAIATVNGEADAQIRPAQGLLDEALLDIASRVEGIAVASPILELDVYPDGRRRPERRLRTLPASKPASRCDWWDSIFSRRRRSRRLCCRKQRTLPPACSNPMRSSSPTPQSPLIPAQSWSCAKDDRRHGCGWPAGCRAPRPHSRWR